MLFLLLRVRCCCRYDTDAASVPVRRLTGDGNSYRKDAGSLDTALATSNVITKAVNVPSRGSAKFATHVGVGEATVASGARQHSGWVAPCIMHTCLQLCPVGIVLPALGCIVVSHCIVQKRAWRKQG